MSFKIGEIGGIATAMLLLLTWGCAGNRELAREKMSHSETAVSDARFSNAAATAPVALKEAEDKLAQARAAFGRDEYDDAARLAEEASVAAEYARVKGRSETTKARAEEMQANIDRLAREIRNAPR